MLFNEPKLLKYYRFCCSAPRLRCFSALQRAEIAEIWHRALGTLAQYGFSALQRAEIAEIPLRFSYPLRHPNVSVLFNEPKLLKSTVVAGETLINQRFSALQRAEIAEMLFPNALTRVERGFSALQRAEIAEIVDALKRLVVVVAFQCSSTSRNC